MIRFKAACLSVGLEKTAVFTVISSCADVVSSMRRAASCHVGRSKFSSALEHHNIKDLFDK